MSLDRRDGTDWWAELQKKKKNMEKLNWSRLTCCSHKHTGPVDAVVMFG